MPPLVRSRLIQKYTTRRAPMVTRGRRRRRGRNGGMPGRRWGVGAANAPSQWLFYTQPNPFKPIMHVKMGYTQLNTLTSGAVGIFGVEQVFSLNNLFDPDFTGVGHFPYGRNTLVTIYGKYKVLGVHVKCTFTDPSADGLVCGMMLSPPNSLVSLATQSIAVAGEKQNTKLKYVNDSGKQIVEMGGYFPMHTLAQITKLQFKANIENYAAVSGASPTGLFIPHLRLAAADTFGTGGLTIRLVTHLTFYVQWYDRLVLAQST